MKKRSITLLLALLLVFSALSGCGLPTASLGNTGDTYAPALQSGTLYAVYDESGALSAFLKLTGRELAVYDARGDETATKTCSFNETDGYYYVDAQQSFSVRDRRDSLTLIARGGLLEAGSYVLSPTGFLAPAEPVPTEAPEEVPAPQPGGTEPAETEAPVVSEEPVPAAPPLMTAGKSYAVYDGDTVLNYLVLGEDSLSILYDDGSLSYEGVYTYDGDLPALLVGGETLVLTLTDGVLYAEEDGETFRLEEVNPGEIPSLLPELPDPDTVGWTETVLASNEGGTLKALLPPALLENSGSSGSEFQAFYSTDGGAFFLSAFLYGGAELEEQLAILTEGRESTEEPAAEEIFRIIQEELTGEVSESFTELGITPETETGVAVFHGTQWQWFNIFGGYSEGRINDLYGFFTMEDGHMALVMVMADASSDAPDYQQTLEELVYGWLLSIPGSLNLE